MNYMRVGLVYPHTTPSWSSIIRTVAALAQVFLMLLILLSGNYNWFNLLTAVLGIAVLHDKGV